MVIGLILLVALSLSWFTLLVLLALGTVAFVAVGAAGGRRLAES